MFRKVLTPDITFAGLYHRPPFKYRYYGKDEKLIDKLDKELRIKLKYIEGCLQSELCQAGEE